MRGSTVRLIRIESLSSDPERKGTVRVAHTTQDARDPGGTLPSHLLRNMEETLKARDKMERDRAARKSAPGENSSVTGSLTANYSHHQREWALQIRALQQRQVGHRGVIPSARVRRHDRYPEVVERW